ncbi:hypothetical protein M8J76_007025 [Diaphorina citri]|nr:hypothetical protein M8J76_007025 [Diaphorina citri]
MDNKSSDEQNNVNNEESVEQTTGNEADNQESKETLNKADNSEANEEQVEELKKALKLLETCSDVYYNNLQVGQQPSTSKSGKKDKTKSTENLLLLTGRLKDYQLVGVEWLWSLYFNGLEGAILADEMGLGKTIQVIAFFCKIIEEQALEPNLIVCPLSVLNNWEAEFRKFAPFVRTVKYYGNAIERKALQSEALSLPTIKVPAKKGKTKKQISLKLPLILVTTPQIIENDFGFLKKITWNCIIVDEGHSVKNKKSKLSIKLTALRATFKVLLTGTPLQNNLRELWTLLEFVQPNNTFNYDKFDSLLRGKLSNLTEGSTDQVDDGTSEIVDTMHNILKPFFLRRLKCDVNLNLPPKKTTVIDCPMVPAQELMYTKVLTKTIGENREQVAEYFNTTVNTSSSSDSSGNESYIWFSEESTLSNASSVKAGKREQTIDSNQLVQQPKRRKCSLNKTYDLTEIDRMFDSMIERDDTSDTEVQVEDKIKVEPCENSSNAQDVPSAEEKKVDEILHHVNVKMTNVTMVLRNIISHPYLINKPYRIVDGKKEMVCDENIVSSSGKMIVLNQLLHKLKQTNHKTLVFSTMVKVLNFIEELCVLENYNYYRLHGSIRNEERNDAVQQFNGSTEWGVFLLSTRAGGQGLNLTAADTCILYDSDWNPQVDIQAEARCHRIGQTKPVCIYRLVSHKTLDEVIYETAQSKLRLGQIILPDHLFKFQTAKEKKVDVRELLNLIRTKTKERMEHPDGKIYTDAEIEKFLDRSDLIAKTRQTQ